MNSFHNGTLNIIPRSRLFLGRGQRLSPRVSSGFEIVVKEAHPGAVMSSYNKVNGIYVNNSYELLTKVLRNEWGFDGLVMTDWFATGKGLGDEAKAIAAGNDLIMPDSKGAKKRILQGVKEGAVSEEDIRRCAANVLKGIVSTDIYRMYGKEK